VMPSIEPAAPAMLTRSLWAVPEARAGGVHAPSPPWLVRPGVARVEATSMLRMSSMVSAGPASRGSAKDVRERSVSSGATPARGSSVARP
jgi:hypothetical protein